MTLFRKLLHTIKGEKFLTIQVSADEILMERIRLPLKSNEMLLYTDPESAPQRHLSDSTPDEDRKTAKDPQMKFWDDEPDS